MTRLRQYASIALLLALGACVTPPPEAEPQAVKTVPEPVIEPEPESEPEPDKASFRLSIAAVGDMMIGTDYPQNHLPDDDGIGFLADVAPVLSAADIAFGNLEGDIPQRLDTGKRSAYTINLEHGCCSAASAPPAGACATLI